MGIGKAAARVLIGGLFVGHGAQKLGGWFGGPGLEGTTGMMTSLDMHPARRNAVAAGLSEAAGGALLAAGLATPLAAATLIGTMTTAIRKVHLANGPWVTNGGWEYNAVLIAAAAAFADQGPGAFSLDRALGIEKQGAAWSLGALALGVGASFAAVEAGRRAKPAEEAAAPLGEQPGDPVTDNG